MTLFPRTDLASVVAMLLRSRLLFLSLFFWITGGSPRLWAQPQTNEDIVSAQVGSYEGLLPSIQYLDWMFQSANSIAQKNAAVSTLSHFQIILRENASKLSPFTHQILEPLKPAELVSPPPSLRAPRSQDESIGSWPWHSLIFGKELSPERRQMRRVLDNLEVHPDFERLRHALGASRDLLVEEISNPQMLDRSLPAYQSSRQSSLEITQSFFKTRMYFRESTGVSPDPFRNLNSSVERFKEGLVVTGEIFRTAPDFNPEVIALVEDYLHEIESLDIPESAARRLPFLPLNSADQKRITELRQKLSSASGKMGDLFAQRWDSLNINKYFMSPRLSFPGRRSCLLVHSF